MTAEEIVKGLDDACESARQRVARDCGRVFVLAVEGLGCAGLCTECGGLARETADGRTTARCTKCGRKDSARGGARREAKRAECAHPNTAVVGRVLGIVGDDPILVRCTDCGARWRTSDSSGDPKGEP